MHVDTAPMLRILAHELRTPAGVAQGYIRMVLEGRLTDPAEQRRALEHTHDAISRMSALGREASEVASWIERSTALRWRTVNLQALLTTMLPRLAEHDVDASVPSLDASLVIRACDESALTTALTSLIMAVTREAPGARLTLAAQPSSSCVDLALGRSNMILDLLHGPSAAGAAPLSLERGGLGLSLVIAVLVLDAHGAAVWTINDQRAALGIRLPVETGQSS
jgi:two-component system OmpR family sensor kinase